MVLKVSQWNATSIVNKKHILSQFLYSNSISVMAVQETFLKPCFDFNIKDYSIIRKDRNSQTQGGGVCFLLHSSLKFQEISANSGNCLIESIVCRLFLKDFSLVLINLYIPPNVNFTKNNLNILLNSIDLLSTDQLFFCGDPNAHHTSLGDSRDDFRGKQLLDFVSENNLVFLNDGSPTFFYTTGSSVLDVTFVSASLALKCDWTSFNDQLLSSHCVIVTTVDCQSNYKKSSEFVPTQLNKNLLNSKFSDFFETISTDDLSESSFVDRFNEFFFKEFKRKAPLKRHLASNPWWTVDCSRVQAKQRLAFSRFKRNPNRANLSEYNSCKNEYHCIIRRAKREG